MQADASASQAFGLPALRGESRPDPQASVKCVCGSLGEAEGIRLCIRHLPLLRRGALLSSLLFGGAMPEN